jgi:hypothetical protein
MTAKEERGRGEKEEERRKRGKERAREELQRIDVFPGSGFGIRFHFCEDAGVVVGCAV